MIFLKNFNHPEIPFAPRKFPFFYGWVILAVGTFGVIMSLPGQTVGVSIFTNFLIESLEISRLNLSLAYMVGTICSGLLLPLGGKFIDKIGARNTAIISALGLSLSLIFLATSARIYHYLISIQSLLSPFLLAFLLISLVFFMLRFTGQGMLTMNCRVMMVKWFNQKRGLAIGISGLMVSFCFSTYPLFANILIEYWNWQKTSFFLASIVGIIMTLVAWIFFRDQPEKCGLCMDGLSPLHENSTILCPSTFIQDYTLSEVLHTYTFWIFNLILGFFALIVTAITFHIVSIGNICGLNRAEVFMLFLPAAIISVISNFISGWISDKINLKYLFLLMLLTLSMLIISILCLDILTGKILYVVGSGISGGLYSVLSSVTWPNYFGRKHLGSITGFNMGTIVFCSAIGAPIFGFSYYYCQNYSLGVYCSIFLALLLLIGCLREKKLTL